VGGGGDHYLKFI